MSERYSLIGDFYKEERECTETKRCRFRDISELTSLTLSDLNITHCQLERAARSTGEEERVSWHFIFVQKRPHQATGMPPFITSDSLYSMIWYSLESKSKHKPADSDTGSLDVQPSLPIIHHTVVTSVHHQHPSCLIDTWLYDWTTGNKKCSL